MKTIEFSHFHEGLKIAVMDALDSYVETATDGLVKHGWLDRELPELFKGIDAHARVLAMRINSAVGPEGVRIDMEN